MSDRVEIPAREAALVAAWKSFHERLYRELVAYLDPLEQLELNSAVADGGIREDDAIEIVDVAVARRAAGETPRQTLPMPRGTGSF